MFDWITNFLTGIMEFIHTYLAFGNYAAAIIIFTLLIKLVVLPLDVKSRKSMRRMSDAQPELNKINEKYKNDPEKRNAKTMEFYKKEKISPTSGCLPLLIQFPVLIAMWGVVRNIANEQTVMMFLNVQAGVDYTAVDFLHPFLWIKNLWQPDNFASSGTIIPVGQAAFAQLQAVSGSSILTTANLADMTRNYMQVMQGPIEFYNATSMNGWGILPVLVFGSQVLSQRLMPKQQQQPDPANKNAGMMKTMNMIMPVMFLFICWGYSAAFSLYFAVSNLYSMVQNLLLNLYFDWKGGKFDKPGSTDKKLDKPGKPGKADKSDKPAVAKGGA